MKAYVAAKLAAAIQVMASQVKTEDDKMALTLASKWLQESDPDKHYTRKVMKRTGLDKASSFRLDGEMRAVMGALMTANRPQHNPIHDRIRKAVKPSSKAVVASDRFAGILRSREESSAVIRSLDGRIAARHERWTREDEDAKNGRDYFVHRDKYGRETRIAWSVIRSRRPDHYRVTPLESRPHSHVSESLSPFWGSVFAELARMKASTIDGKVCFIQTDTAIADRPVPAAIVPVFPVPVLPLRPNAGIVRHSQLEQHGPHHTIRGLGCVPSQIRYFAADGECMCWPRPVMLSEHTFTRTSDDAVIRYRGNHEPSPEMIAFDPETVFNPRTETAKPSEDAVPSEYIPGLRGVRQEQPTLLPEAPDADTRHKQASKRLLSWKATA